MTLTSLRIGLVSLVLAFTPGSARACQLTDVLLGSCDADLAIEVPPQGSPRGAVSLKRLWTNDFTNFTNLQTATLNVCFFKEQAKDSKGNLTPKIAVLSDQQWKLAARSVAKNASDWTKLKLTVNGSALVSRLEFNFLDQTGGFRVCEETPDDQIRVMFNVSRVHRSKVGIDSNGYTGWSMTLSLRSGLAPRYAVLHEFGHALGFLHEMGHPDWKTCAETLEPEAIWTKGMFGDGIGKQEELDRIRKSVLDAASGYGKLAATSTYDPHSVMTYELPASAFPGRPECALDGFVEEISDEDTLLFMRYYGKQG